MRKRYSSRDGLGIKTRPDNQRLRLQVAITGSNVGQGADLRIAKNVKAEARIVRAESPRISDHSLVGLKISFDFQQRWAQSAKQRVVLLDGLLYSLLLPLETTDNILDELASTPLESGSAGLRVFEVHPIWFSPMREPCVRVPLSLLQELRGQVAYHEYSRQALIAVYLNDRKTGAAARISKPDDTATDAATGLEPPLERATAGLERPEGGLAGAGKPNAPKGWKAR